MKLLSDILYGVSLIEVRGSTNIAIESLTQDSRKVRNNSLFIAVKGTLTDGHNYIEQSTQNGCIAVVCENLPTKLYDKITYILVKNAAEALGIVAANFYDNPSEQLKIIGVTGTNGKTTTTTLLYNLFKKMGYKVGLLSTVVNKILNEEIPATHTTPDAIQLNSLLRQMLDKGCTHCFMEVSSHALHQKRVHGVKFTCAVFTNITHDHLDYHKTFDEYIKAKKIFFDFLPSSSYAILNKDDYHSDIMIQNCKAKIKTYAIKSMADYKAKIIENQFTGLMLNINGKEVWTKIIGSFNAYNVLAVYAVTNVLGMDEISVLTAISTLQPVDGRFEYIKNKDNVTAIVDYAHTPDALKNVLQTIKDIKQGNEKIITVVGCGGDRDKSKRPLMAAIACQLSDKVILTSDNPRSEEPDTIINDMKKGIDVNQLKKVLSITNRREAIKTACAFAQAGDIILVAGKGHEKYQEIKGEKYPFDDLHEIKECFKTIES
jgi:UDP-N-acetylmuramoyl-L-alanyl-D-glutamate--2,6-diaminopimelate ligase